MSGNNFQESGRSFDNYCSTYKFVAIRPERMLKTKLFGNQKAIFQGNKRFSPANSRNIECHEPQGTICLGLKQFLTITLEIIRSSL